MGWTTTVMDMDEVVRHGDRESPNFDTTPLVGMAPDQAILVAKGEGITQIRVLEVVAGLTRTVMTMDRQFDRLNLLVEGGKVVGASFG
jgi:hypothetical protein